MRRASVTQASIARPKTGGTRLRLNGALLGLPSFVSIIVDALYGSRLAIQFCGAHSAASIQPFVAHLRHPSTVRSEAVARRTGVCAVHFAGSIFDRGART